MRYQGSIRAVNALLNDFAQRDSDHRCAFRPARLAEARLAGKFEEPLADIAAKRRNDAWERWIGTDSGLQTRELLGPHWAKARLLIHDVLSSFKMGPLTFTNGSSFVPLGNQTSIACKLSGEWTITPDCFDLFASYSYWHRALKHAVKKRFKSYCTSKGWVLRSINRKLWARFSILEDPAFQIYKFKLECIVSFVQGNRWSTVPKNNLKDRSICLEPLCNMLVQRAVGLGVRACLKDKLGIDLDYLADVHRNRISDPKVATIDLSDCSDTISLWLIKYLLPRRVLSKVLACRSDMTLGPDDNFYVVFKVSSMGNGFTFDLMTLILTALTKSFDLSASVFGDDIICQNQYADEIIQNLSIAGFRVNLDKTYIRSDYRESCGAHFIDGYGYVTVFDLRWLRYPHDLIVACNKVAILSSIYGGPFETLRTKIWSCVPRSLLGATTSRLVVSTGRPPSYELDSYVRYGPPVQVDPSPSLLKRIRRHCKRVHKPGNISVAQAVVSRTCPAKPHLSSTQWDLFFQWIHNCRVERRVSNVVFKSTMVARVGEEQIGFTNALL